MPLRVSCEFKAGLRRGRVSGLYDPTGPGCILSAFFAAMAEIERENIREATLEGLDAASRKSAALR